MRIAIDGTTGLLGRNLLFEILKQNLKHLDDIEIIILGKGANEQSLAERMNEIIFNDGFDYLNIDRNSDYFDNIKSRITYIDFDLTLPNLGLNQNDIAVLKKKKIDYFYHIASNLTFGYSNEITRLIYLINFYGAKHLLELANELKVKEFIYLSSAYSAGASQKEVFPNFINNTGIFRNPYEKSKLETELYLMDFAKHNNLLYKIFRPTTISGRLIEKEIGAINKYDVFYGWGVFFLKYKYNIFKSLVNIYDKPLEISLRIFKHPEAVMNIIPADYAAKLLYSACLDGLNEHFFHLVNDSNIPVTDVIKIILCSLNIQGWQFVDEEPEDKNRFEQFYYRTVGKIFTPYINDPPIYYNNDNLKGIMKEYNLKCPEMNEANFQKLIDFAKKHNFGI